MARKRVRDFRRISMTAKTARFIRSNLIYKTVDHHVAHCEETPEWLDGEECKHERSKSLPVAHLLAHGLKIGKKRATLDIQCPYSTDDPEKQVKLLKHAANRLIFFVDNEKRQLQDAMRRISDEILDYANRNAMQVIAEAAR